MVRGEILGLVGASGGGKSVLLRTILGLIPKAAGTIEILGDRSRQGEPRRDLRALERRWGVLYQQGALFSSLTVFQNIEFPMREYLDLSPRLMREVATAKLEMVGLDAADGDKLPAELSGGMTKRVALARALALDPEIVFLDEPTSGLDPISAGEFDALIKTLQRTLRPDRLHGDPRPRLPAAGLRPDRRPGRWTHRRNRIDGAMRASAASLGASLFSSRPQPFRARLPNRHVR